MIVYDKLMNILSERQMNKRQLSEAIGIKANTMSALSKNRNVNTETINRICEYLQVQPSEIMEWIPDADYEKQNAEKQAIEQQIAELQAKLKNVRRQTMQPTQNSTQTQNIDDDLQFMLEYYNEAKSENSMEIQMLDHGVSWSDFL